MTLRTLFAIPIAIVLLVTLSLAAMMAGQGWSNQVNGRAAVTAMEGMRLLVDVETALRTERVASNLALGKPFPLSKPVQARLDDARRQTDQGINAIVTDLIIGGPDGSVLQPDLANLATDLWAIRATIDELIVRGEENRSHAELSTVMPRMIAVSQLLRDPLERAIVAVTRIDPGLSGLVTEERLSVSLRNQIGAVAARLLPRANMREQPSESEQEQVRIALARASFLIRLLDDTMEIAGGTDQIRTALADLRKINFGELRHRLNEQMRPEVLQPRDDNALSPPQLLLVPLGEQINALRTAIVDAMVQHVIARRDRRERQFDIVMAGLGVVMVAVLESAVLLSQRVVVPLAQLGMAIRRIAGGDRSIPLTLQFGTSDINEMVSAVETLRRAALIADAAASRQQMAARHRLNLLHEALGIVRTVHAPGRELERDVASLSEGIDATIALVGTETDSAPATLGLAADAVRLGLADMLGSTAEFEAAFAAAGKALEEDPPEAEFVARILAVQAQVGRRDEAVRALIKPSLVALRDAGAACGGRTTMSLRDLVSDQFLLIEATVATLAAMREAVARATAIVRGLTIDEATLAA
jgi:hypothetical protein